MFDNRQILEYLQDLVYKDLVNHFTGDPQSIVSADDLKFKSLSSEEVQMRKKILMNISKLLSELGKGQIPKKTVPSLSDPYRQTYGKYSEILSKIPIHGCFEISKCIIYGRKIDGIKNIRSYTGLGLKEAKDMFEFYLPNSNVSEKERKRASQNFLNDSSGDPKIIQ